MERVHGFWILIFTFCCFLIASTVNATPIVRLEQSATDILVGEDVIISVFADGVTETDFFSGLPDEVLSFGFDLDYDSTEFNLTTAVVKLPFSDDSAFFTDTDVAGDVFPGIGGDNILLATLTFNALEEGNNLNIGIVSDILDANEGLGTWIYDGFFNAKIDMTSAVSVNVAAASAPEPTTMLLFGIGLLGFSGVARKKKK